MTLKQELKNKVADLLETQRKAIVEKNLAEALRLEKEIADAFSVLKVIK